MGNEKTPFFESGKFHSPEFVIKNTYFTDKNGNILNLSPEELKNPEIYNSIPYIIVYLGPARSGTTAISALFAGMKDIAASYFQPFKNGIRHGKEILTPLNLPPVDANQSRPATTTLPLGTISYLHSLPQNTPFSIFMKDTLGPLAEEELFDPVSMLLQRGIPPEKIIFIPTLRKPIKVYASLQNFVTDGMDINYFERMQSYLLSLYERYLSEGLTVIPFAYELIQEIGAENAIRALIRAINNKKGLNLNENFALSFNREALGVNANWYPLPPTERVNSKMFWGEADPYGEEEPNFTYWREAVLPTLERGGYKPTSGSAASSKGEKGVKADNLPLLTRLYIERLCEQNYNRFYEESKEILKKYL